MFDYIRQNFLKSPEMSELPPAVQERIAKREWGNELLLRGIQLAIILMFCFIYTISPKTYPEGSFAPAPYVLGAYLTLSVIGLVWGTLREPPDWSSYVSILFDFGLLYGLMVSFHIQYEQPASFILKAPALLYVFIFIAIRALRFHPKFVIAAGFVAIAGWAVVMMYVIRIDPGDNMLTRSYVAYLTSNSILIGAEVDKLISILFVTAVLALAMNGTNNLLVTAITEQSAADEFSRFFDSSVARNIRSSDRRLTAGQGEKWPATILNVDIRGFTVLAERLDADSVMRALSAYQGRVISVVSEHHGIVDKFMGDGIMTAFGIGGASETYAADAMRTAEAILLDARLWAEEEPDIAAAGELRIGIGLASGVVNWGAVGRGDRLEMTVIGPAVNLSAKIEKHNKVLSSSCIADAGTWSLARMQGYEGLLEADLRKTEIDGMREPVQIAVLSLPERLPVPENETSRANPACNQTVQDVSPIS